MQCSALYPFSKERSRQFLDEVLDLSASKWRWIGPMLCQFDNLGGVDIVTTNDQESPLVGDISLRPCLIRQSGELQCIASPPSISQKKREKRTLLCLCSCCFFSTAKKRVRPSLSSIDTTSWNEPKLHLGEWKWPKEMKATTAKEKKSFCQKWDSNPRPHSRTRTLNRKRRV